MDMNKTFFLRNEDRRPNWRLIDATGKVVGRLATEIANALRGKDKSSYTAHSDSGDYVVVVNADKIVFTGNKMRDKEYAWYTNWIGGYKTLSAQEMLRKNPTFLLMHAVKGMLGSRKLARAQLKKCLIYAGPTHPHQAQITTSEKKARS